MKKTNSQKNRKEKLHEILLAEKKKVLQDLRKSLGSHLEDDPRWAFDVFQDNADKSVDDLLKHVDVTLMGYKSEMLDKIDEALKKMQQGTYGLCEECGQLIKIERLKLVPFAIYCVTCQNEMETLKKSKIGREETSSLAEDSDDLLSEDDF